MSDEYTGPDWTFDMTCLQCGGYLVPVALGNPVALVETNSVVQCVDCQSTFHVRVWIQPMTIRNASSFGGLRGNHRAQQVCLRRTDCTF